MSLRIGIIIFFGLIFVIIKIVKPVKVPKCLRYIMIVIAVILAAFEFVERINQTKQESIEKYSGVLKSESFLLVSSDPSTFPKLEIGDSGAFISKLGDKNIKFISKLLEENNFKIEYENRQIKVSMTIRERGGKVVAEIVKNEWKLNRKELWDRNYSKNALEIKDPYGDIVLQVKLVKNRVQLQGKFYGRIGKYFGLPNCDGVEIWKDKSNKKYPGCITIKVVGLASELKIDPIFKYPSDHHLGEFIESQKK